MYEQVIFDFGAMLPPIALLEASSRWIIAQEHTAWEENLTKRYVSIANRMTEGSFAEKVVKIGEVMP